VIEERAPTVGALGEDGLKMRCNRDVITCASLNNAPLNDANFELEVNFLEYWEIKPSGKTTHFSRVTDIPIIPDNLVRLMRAARARWKVENETFNTLKNHGYHFEHNFGHGYHQLSTVMVHLMMLAFLID